MKDAVHNFAVLKDDDDSRSKAHHKGSGKYVAGAGKQFIGNTAGIKPGKTLRFYVSQFAFAQLQINDANWGQIACPKFDDGAAPAIIDVVMDADFCTTVMETSDGWGDTAMVVQGEGLIVTKVTLK